MSWSPLLPFPRRGVAARSTAPVIVSGSRQGRYRQVLTITVRPQFLVGGLPFWRVGNSVTAELGTGDHAGLLRILLGRGGPFPLRPSAGRRQDVVLRLPALPGQSPEAQPAIACDHDWSDDWIEITLPSWARAGENSPAPPAPVAAEKSTGSRSADENSPARKPAAARLPPQLAAGRPGVSAANPFAVPKELQTRGL